MLHLKLQSQGFLILLLTEGFAEYIPSRLPKCSYLDKILYIYCFTENRLWKAVCKLNIFRQLLSELHRKEKLEFIT